MDRANDIRCPQCGKPVTVAGDELPEGFPFCSRRCRLVDLGAWFDGRHAIPGRPGAFDADDPLGQG